MQLTKKQILSIAEASAFLNIWEGSVRSGKTYGSIVAFGKFALTCGPGELMIVGRTFESISRNIIKPFQELFSGFVSWAPGKRILTLGDKQIWVVGASDERAAGKIQGSTLIGAYVDEISLIPKSFFDMLISRLSLSNARLFGTTNPDSPFHWLKEVIDKADGKYLRHFHFRLEDNPHLPENYISNLKRSYTGLWYERYINGKWVLAEGTIYDFFNETVHCIDFPPKLPQQYIVGVDYGTSNACAFLLIGINRTAFPNVWVESEYYWDSRKTLRQKTDSEYANDLRAFISNKPVTAIYIDPSALSFKLELSKQGINGLYDADNEVLDGIRFVSTMLSEGTLRMCRGCRNLIKEMQTYAWDEKSQKLGIDKPLKRSDHLADALRYAIYTHFFNKSFNPLTAQQLDQMYQEAYVGAEFPGPFTQPRF